MNKPIDISATVLSTQRLILRPWREMDLADFHAYARVDGVGQMAGWLPHKNIEESRDILCRFIRGQRVFALEYQGKVIGSLGVEKYEEQDFPELEKLQGRELGYVLSKDYWGQGLMPEAVRAVLTWLFEEEKLDFVTVRHYEKNARSRRVIEKCGFQYRKTVTAKTRFGTEEPTLTYILFAKDVKK